jgi:hypothetical protein
MSDTENASENSNKDEIVTEMKYFFDSKFRELKRDFRLETEWNNQSGRKMVQADNLVSFSSATSILKYLSFWMLLRGQLN